MNFYYEGKGNWKIGKRAKYMNELNRNQASTIFKTRTRMLKVKGNYKNGFTNQECRLCKKLEENQQHILEECKILNNQTAKVTKEMAFSENTKELKITAQKIEKRMETMENLLETN